MNRVINGGRYMFFDLYHLPNETPEQYEARYQERLAKHKEWLADAPRREAEQARELAELKATLAKEPTKALYTDLCELVRECDDRGIDSLAYHIVDELERRGEILFNSVELTPKRYTVKK